MVLYQKIIDYRITETTTANAIAKYNLCNTLFGIVEYSSSYAYQSHTNHKKAYYIFGKRIF